MVLEEGLIPKFITADDGINLYNQPHFQSFNAINTRIREVHVSNVILIRTPNFKVPWLRRVPSCCFVVQG